MPTCLTLKRMAADPCAEDWGERLVIDYGEPMGTAEAASHAGEMAGPVSTSLSRAVGNPSSGKLFAEAGEQQRLF